MYFLENKKIYLAFFRNFKSLLLEKIQLTDNSGRSKHRLATLYTTARSQTLNCHFYTLSLLQSEYQTLTPFPKCLRAFNIHGRLFNIQSDAKILG